MESDILRTKTKLEFSFTVKNIIMSVVIYATILMLFFTAKFPWWVLVILAGVDFVVVFMKIELSNRMPWVWTGMMFLLASAASTFLIQYMLIDITKYKFISNEKILLNMLCYFILHLMVLFFTNNSKLSCLIAYVFSIVLGFIDYFVYDFRGNEFTYSDLKSIGTGLSVAKNYTFSLDYKCVFVIFVSILFCSLIMKLSVKFKKPWFMRLIVGLLVAICAINIYFQTVDVSSDTWNMSGTCHNGFILKFFVEIRDSFVPKPKGYSIEAIQKLASQYTEKDNSHSEATVENPTIIVIMNESFSDLRVLGDIETNEELMPFIDSLSENTLKGYALSSIYGGKTANSEWEYMTGNSMAFLKGGSVVYQQYIDKQPHSLVSTLKNMDYTCVAMHPYFKNGWSRNKVYSMLGYDEKHFIEDFDRSQLMRDYITDEELYRKIIKRYENKSKDEKLYIMGVTMQNHSSYDYKGKHYKQYIYKDGKSDSRLNQYLQLVHESDAAIKELITYFSNVDDPVEIVFFGDHQPGFGTAFYEDIFEKDLSDPTLDESEKSYRVPFFIWTNYETKSDIVDITSLNYLSTLTLERANIDLPAYNQFLAKMMKVVPAINSQGYYSIMNGKFMPIKEATGEEAQWLLDYNMLQYDNMFGDKKRNDFFFPYLK